MMIAERLLRSGHIKKDYISPEIRHNAIFMIEFITMIIGEIGKPHGTSDHRSGNRLNIFCRRRGSFSTQRLMTSRCCVNTWKSKEGRVRMIEDVPYIRASISAGFPVVKPCWSSKITVEELSKLRGWKRWIAIVRRKPTVEWYNTGIALRNQ